MREFALGIAVTLGVALLGYDRIMATLAYANDLAKRSYVETRRVTEDQP